LFLYFFSGGEDSEEQSPENEVAIEESPRPVSNPTRAEVKKEYDFEIPFASQTSQRIDPAIIECLSRAKFEKQQAIEAARRQREESRAGSPMYNVAIAKIEERLKSSLYEFVLEFDVLEIGSVGRLTAYEISEVIDHDNFIAERESGDDRVWVRGFSTDQLIPESPFTMPGMLRVTGRVNVQEDGRQVETLVLLERCDVDALVAEMDAALRDELTAEWANQLANASDHAAPPEDSVTNGRFRTWVDKTGQFRAKAAFVKSIGDRVTLEKESGEQIEIRKADLSDEDREWLNERAQKNRYAN
jgi:hypothetical protein